MDAEPQRRGAKVVDPILDATVRELARVGFAGLSVEEVATRAGVNKTTIYRRWPTKTELVLAALMREKDGAGNEPDTGSVAGDLLEYTRRVRAKLSTPEGRGVFIALLADEPAVANVAAELVARSDTPIKKILKRAIKRGELPRDVDMNLVGELLFGALQVRLLFIRDAHMSDEYLEKVVALVVAGANATSR